MSNLLPANIMAVRLLFSICQQVHEGGLSLKVPVNLEATSLNENGFSAAE